MLNRSSLPCPRCGVRGPATVGADRARETRDFVSSDLSVLGVAQKIAQNEGGRRSAVGGHTTLNPGYRRSQPRRKLVDEVFAWSNMVGADRDAPCPVLALSIESSAAC